MGEARLDFAAALLPSLRARPCFRAPTEHEIDASYAVYCGGDFARLCDVWRSEAQAQRAVLPPGLQRGYDHAGLLPSGVNAYSFLATMRAVLEAGVRFRAGLSAPTRAALHRDFPWLERRHEHIPPGWAPHFEFPPEFAAWIDVPELDEAKRRWQLAAGLNEVQQAHQSEDCARRFRLPALRLHAARERELAINYFGHSAPAVTRACFSECLYVLDALNAAVFSLLCLEMPGQMARRSVLGALTHRAEWRAFEAGLARTQWLLPLEGAR